MRELANWEIIDNGEDLIFKKSFIFRGQRKLIEFIKALLELSNEFIVNPRIEIFYPKVITSLQGPSKERDRLSIFAMAIDDTYEKFSGY